jgi:HEAT repeat protein
MLKVRKFAERHPELVQPLTELFNTSEDPDVRQVCIQILTQVSPDGEAPPVLFQALTDPHAWVVLSGMGALHYFPNPDAMEPLCRFIDSRPELGIDQAMGHLGEMADPKAVPTLAGVLLDSETKHDQTFVSAAIALARCGQSGFAVLVSALEHDDPRIRHAAVVGLDVSGNEAAKPYLDKAKNDPDPGVRRRANTCVGRMPF